MSKTLGEILADALSQTEQQQLKAAEALKKVTFDKGTFGAFIKTEIRIQNHHTLLCLEIYRGSGIKIAVKTLYYLYYPALSLKDCADLMEALVKKAEEES